MCTSHIAHIRLSPPLSSADLKIGLTNLSIFAKVSSISTSAVVLLRIIPPVYGAAAAAKRTTDCTYVSMAKFELHNYYLATAAPISASPAVTNIREGHLLFLSGFRIIKSIIDDVNSARDNKVVGAKRSHTEGNSDACVGVSTAPKSQSVTLTLEPVRNTGVVQASVININYLSCLATSPSLWLVAPASAAVQSPSRNRNGSEGQESFRIVKAQIVSLTEVVMPPSPPEHRKDRMFKV